MTFVVGELPKARQDKDSIFRWLHERSPGGAFAWLESYDALIARLTHDAAMFGLVPENADCELEVRQGLFKTRGGRVYRALFFVEGEDAFVLRVRGPGQAPVIPNDMR